MPDNEPDTHGLAESRGVSNPLVLLQSMIERGTDPDALGKMMDLAERWEANQAAAAYGRALAAFQAECPVILKSRKADRYIFAGYDNVMKTAGPILAKHAISVSFSTPTTAERFDLIMRVQVGSHYQDKPYSAPMPDLDKLAAQLKLTQPQAFGIASSYHKRYCFVNGLNIVCSDTDETDCQPVNGMGVYCANGHIVAINTLLEAIATAEAQATAKGIVLTKPFNKASFLEWLQAPSIGEILLSKFETCMKQLERKLKETPR